MTMVTTMTRKTAGNTGKTCRKCGSNAAYQEQDAVGIMEFCRICGNCIYLDHDGNAIEELDRKENKQNKEVIQEENMVEAIMNETEHPTGELLEEPGTGGENKQPDQAGDGCEKCGATRKDTEFPRYVRLPLRQCAECGHWTVNTDFSRELDSPDEINGAVMQMYVGGANSREICEMAERITGRSEVKNTQTNLWRARYLSHSTQKMRELRPRTSIRWRLGHFVTERGKKQHNCWAIMDTDTSFILAASTSENGIFPQDLMDIAQKAASITPVEIITEDSSNPVMEKLRQKFPLASISQASSGEIDPDCSLSRLDRNIKQRLENNKSGPLDGGMMERVLQEAVISTNLFEETTLEGNPTPAEAGGIESPFRDWGDLTTREKPNTTTYRPTTQSNKQAATGKAPGDAPGNAPGDAPGNAPGAKNAGKPKRGQARKNEPGQNAPDTMRIAREQLHGKIEEIRGVQQEVSQHLENLQRDREALERALELLA